MINSKKGTEGLTLTQIIGIVMAVIGVIALTLLIVRLSKPFFGKQDYDATKNNFDELTDKVQELLDNKKDFAVERNFPYFIDKNYVLIGFDKDWDEDVYIDNCIRTKEIEQKAFKPSRCSDKACLCLYKTALTYWDEDKKEDNVLHCAVFDGNIIFLSKHVTQDIAYDNRDDEGRTKLMSNNYGKERDISNPDYEIKTTAQYKEYAYLSFNSIFTNIRKKYSEGVISAECDEITWKVQNLYIEKQEIGNKIYFYITIEDDETDDRYNSLKS